MRQKMKFYFIIGLFFIAAFISWKLYFAVYTQQDTIDIHQFPKQLDGWTSEEMTITEEEYAILETRNVFSRRYTSVEGEEVYLFIVYSENNRKVSHPPEICYTGGGATVTESRHTYLNSKKNGIQVKTNRLLLDLNNSQQVVNYWFKVGNTFTANYWKQQGLIAIKTFLGKPSSSALIRLSTIVPNGDFEKADNRINKFSKLLLPEILPNLP